MHFDRVYTDGVTSPFDMVKWENRTVEIREENGNLVFVQTDVEVPDFWDEVATSMLANKYFRRAKVPAETVKVPEQGVFDQFCRSIPKEGTTFGGEHSLRQVAHRLVGNWVYWMCRENHFDTEDDANVFYDEMIHILINQIAEPNSPQFFNTGLGWAYGNNNNYDGYYFVDEKTGKALEYEKNREAAICRQQAQACVAGDTRILTDAGWIQVKDLVNGKVKAKTVWDGEEWTDIKASISSGIKDIYRMKLQNGNWVDMTRDHQVLVSENSSSIWMDAEDTLNKKVHLCKNTNIDNMLKIDYDNASELVGFHIGDGYYGEYAYDTQNSGNTSQFGICCSSTEELEYFKPIVENILGSYSISYRKNISEEYAIIKNHKKSEHKIFAQKYELGVGSHNVKIPEQIWMSNFQSQIDFLKGLFQAGGSVYLPEQKHSGIRLGTVSGQLAHDIQIMLLGLGIYSSLSFNKDYRDNRKGCWYITISTYSERLRFEKIIGFSCSVKNIKLSRLNLINKGRTKNNISYETVKSFEYLKTDEVYDIQTGTGRFAANGVIVHNCFILNVKDSMFGEESIYDTLMTEAKIFKGGSGAGANFSNLRGAGEQLSSGGTSSGVMSFLKILDRSADSVKSGGVSRRAAKMVILDIDHPEVEDFIDWKLDEEQKVAAMISGAMQNSLILNKLIRKWNELGSDAAKSHKEIKKIVKEAMEHSIEVGYIQRAIDLATQGKSEMPFIELTNNFNDDAYHTVSGQNSNNSISITDAFMKSLESNAKWQLKRRTDGKTAKEVTAKSLWDKIGYAAWSSADPGVIFKDTMNAWNTCSNDGEIVATNPCFSGDTRIATPEGLIPIKELVSNAVHTGKMTPVYTKESVISKPVAYMSTGENNTWEVELSDGRIVKCTENHNWYINGKKIETKDLIEGMEVGLLSLLNNDSYIGNSKLPADSTLAKYIDSGCRKDIHSNISQEWTTDLAEIIGYFLGDGSFCQSKRYHSATWIFGTNPEDKEDLADRYKEILHNLLGGYKLQDNINSSNCRILRVTRKPFINFLLDLGCKKVTAENKRVPESIFRAPKNIIAAYLKGYFTADGTVYGKESEGSVSVSVTSVSKNMLQDVQMLLDIFGIRSRISLMKESGKSFSDKYRSKDCYRLMIDTRDIILYNNEISFSLKYKSEKLQSLLNIRKNIKVRSGYDKVCIKSVYNTGNIEITYNLTEPKNNLVFANGILIAQCSEYNFLNSTACNLSSARLTKFYENGKFDVDKFAHVCRLFAVVLEISVTSAMLPTKSMSRGTYNYRTLGMGYCDVGTLMMIQGIPYDSPEAMAQIGAITALMTGQVYLASTEMAKEVGPFARYAENKDSMLRVLRNHRRALIGDKNYEKMNVSPVPVDKNYVPAEIYGRAVEVWNKLIENAEQYGVRNAFVTVLAPTGSIGLLMGADTTGIEPDFSLVKYKKLSGGGYIRIINRSVPEALAKLGYNDKQIQDITNYIVGSGRIPEVGEGITAQSLKNNGINDVCIESINNTLNVATSITQAFNKWTLGENYCTSLGFPVEELSNPEIGNMILDKMGYSKEQIEEASALTCGHGTIEGAPYVSLEHYPVFDCAVPSGKYGSRQIHYMGHLRAVAAAQPFLSGASSKTINMSKSATIEEIQNCYAMAYKLGIKCVALYRDSCKLSQPMNTISEAELFDFSDIADDESFIAAIREKLPAKRYGQTHEFHIGPFGGPYHKIFLRTGEYSDGRLGEIFINYAEEDAFARTLLDSFARAVSIGLQRGVPKDEYFALFRSISQDPSGQVLHPNVKVAKSIFDAIGKILQYEYNGDDDAVEMPTPREEQMLKMSGRNAHHVEHIHVDEKEKATLKQCKKCGGTEMIQTSSCSLRCRRCNTAVSEGCGG